MQKLNQFSITFVLFNLFNPLTLYNTYYIYVLYSRKHVSKNYWYVSSTHSVE